MSLIILSLVVFAGVSYRRHHWGIYAVLAGLPVYQIRFPVLGIPTTYLEWLVLTLAGAVAARLVIRRITEGRWPSNLARIDWKMWLMILLLLGAGAMATVVSPVPMKALGIFKAYFAEGFLFWLVCVFALDNRNKLLGAVGALLVLTAYLSIFGIYQFFTLYRLPPSWWGNGIETRRVVSLFTYPNAPALLVAPILALGAGLAAAFRPWKEKAFYLPAVISLVLGSLLLILTFSRGGWLALAAGLVVIGIFSPFRKQLAIGVVIVAFALLLIPASRNRIIPAINGSDPAGQERLKLYQKSLIIIREQPLTGAGLMGFREWYGGLRDRNRDEVLNYPHNFILNFWTETGLPGLMAIIGLLGLAFREMHGIIRKSAGDTVLRALAVGTLAGLTAWMVHGLVDVPFFKNDLALLFWFFAALTVIVRNEKFKNISA